MLLPETVNDTSENGQEGTKYRAAQRLYNANKPYLRPPQRTDYPKARRDGKPGGV